MSIRHPRSSSAAALAFAVSTLLLLGVALGGCVSDKSSASPRASVAPSGPTLIPTDPDATPDGSSPTQTDTEWGRIWDALPDNFHEYPGASPTETGAGPASAILDVGDEEPAAVIDFYRTAFDADHFSMPSADGPREDGSWELEAVSAFVPECRIRVTATPMGTTTIVEIMYGAGCPFE